mgnify:FL=1
MPIGVTEIETQRSELSGQRAVGGIRNPLRLLGRLLGHKVGVSSSREALRALLTSYLKELAEDFLLRYPVWA